MKNIQAGNHNNKNMQPKKCDYLDERDSKIDPFYFVANNTAQTKQRDRHKSSSAHA